MDFTTVIPTFRRPAELRDALASVLRQSGVTLEILVVDDSPEGSAEAAVQAFADPRINYRKNPRPTGGFPSIVRNLAWPLARGDFIHFLDDDDIVPEGHYAAVKQAFAENPRVGLVFGRIEPFGEGPEEQLRHELDYFARAARKAAASARFGTKAGFVSNMLFGDALLVCSSAAVRRGCVERVGGFDPDIRLMEDADFNVRVMRACGAVFLDRPVLHYRIGYPSLMHAPNPPPAQLAEVREGHRRMQRKYRRDRGVLEFLLLALFARTVLRLL